MKNRLMRLSFFITVVFVVLVHSAQATELYIPKITANPGQIVDIPIMIDQTDNLAGIKLKLPYDDKVLTYIEGNKTKHTSSLMHVVNDKKSGVLIIVMAGAKGIAGKNMPLFVLKFKANQEIKAKVATKLSISELQLMGDDLKDIKCTVKINELLVLPKSE